MNVVFFIYYFKCKNKNMNTQLAGFWQSYNWVGQSELRKQTDKYIIT